MVVASARFRMNRIRTRNQISHVTKKKRLTKRTTSAKSTPTTRMTAIKKMPTMKTMSAEKRTRMQTMTQSILPRPKKQIRAPRRTRLTQKKLKKPKKRRERTIPRARRRSES